MGNDNKQSEEPGPLVVLVHGLAAHRLVFIYLQWHLKKQGLPSNSWGYRSVWRTIEIHAERLERRLAQLDADPRYSKIHLVCHSMGGIVARQTLLNFVPTKMGRLVMMATPNQGSPAARFLSKNVFPFSKTLAQISDEPESYVRNLEFPQGIDVGVIFANVDRVVSLESSLPTPVTPYVEIASGHNDLLLRPTMAKQVTHFIKTGEFVH